jgi:Zn-dependent M28 family amino/carboxypeptidase
MKAGVSWWLLSGNTRFHAFRQPVEQTLVYAFQIVLPVSTRAKLAFISFPPFSSFMSRKPLLVAALVLTFANLTVAQNKPATKLKVKAKAGKVAAIPLADFSIIYANTISAEDLRKHLNVLASDEYEGRETGRKGQKMAAEYISRQFAEMGLTGPVKDSDNPYLQHFTLERVGLGQASTVKMGNRTFVMNQDFHLALRDAATATGVVQPAFVGYGISTTGYTDFTPDAAALKNKNLVLLLGEPLNKAGQPILGKEGQASPYGAVGPTEMMTRSPALRTLAPRSTFRIEPSAAAFAQAPRDYAGVFDPHERIAFPGEPPPVSQGSNLFIVSPEMGAAMLSTTTAGLARYQKAVTAAGKPVASPFKPATITVLAADKKETFTTENVLGYLEGTDKKDEVLVISAHYDHIGVQNGVIYNGADDDGSGTVSVLALARAFAQAKKDGYGSRRSILFLANVGEEKGLLGSRYYTDHPAFPLANTIADLNIDMLGRVDSLHMNKGDYVYVIGDDRLSSQLHTLSEATNQKYNPVALDYRYNDPSDPEHLYTRSDHYNFAKHKVPVIFYTSGLHPDYHKATDDVDKIDFVAMTRRDQLIFHTAWELANRDNRLVVDSKKP